MGYYPEYVKKTKNKIQLKIQMDNIMTILPGNEKENDRKT